MGNLFIIWNFGLILRFYFLLTPLESFLCSKILKFIFFNFIDVFLTEMLQIFYNILEKFIDTIASFGWNFRILNSNRLGIF